MKNTLTLVLIVLSLTGFGQKNPTEEAQPIVAEGKLVYKLEMASWVGTDLFLEKYKVSQTTLMELLNIKNQVIQTKENLIKINIALNQNAININYIQGDINAQNLIN